MKTANDFFAEVDYLTEHNAIVKTLQHYIDGSRAGNSELMHPAFHPDATLVGYVGGNLLFTPIKVLFDWIDENGPAPDIESEFGQY